MKNTKTRIMVDAHLDLAYNAIILGRDLKRPVKEIRDHERTFPPAAPDSGTCLVSIPELLKGRFAIVFGSIFVPPSWPRAGSEPLVYHDAEEAHRYAIPQLDLYRRWRDEEATICLLENQEDLRVVLDSWQDEMPQMGIFVMMEGAEPIQTPDQLTWWVERGLRGIGLSWSAGTSYAGGNAAPDSLTDKGKTLLRRMAEYNLALDLSHLWEAAAYEALDRYPGPVIASHANPRVLVDSPRLLSDDLILHIAEREGVVGVIPFNQMLEEGWNPGDARLPLQRVAEAIDYICQLVGNADCVGIGSDFDGGFGLDSVPLSIDTIADLVKLVDLLEHYGYSDDDMDRILSGNWIRVLQSVLGAF